MRVVWYRLLFFLPLFGASLLFASGQDARVKTEPSGKVIEVHSDGSRPPLTIALRLDRPAGFWTSNFPRVKDWKQPADEEPAQVVNFSAKLIGDNAEVIISVFKGKRFGEKTEPVATLLLSEGESETVSGLSKYGYLPLTVKLAGVATTTVNVPLVTNPAQSLRAVVSPTVSTLPEFKVKLTNESSKAVLALGWHTEAGGRMLLSSVPQGRHGKPLMDANGEYEAVISAVNPNPLVNNITLAIEWVIYEDRTVEGDERRAATFFSFMEGRKNALSRLLPILRTASEAGSQRLDVVGLIRRVDSVFHGGETITSGSGVGRPATPVGIAFEGVVKELLDALRKLDAASVGKTDADIQVTLRELTSFYEEWLGRLSK